MRQLCNCEQIQSVGNSTFGYMTNYRYSAGRGNVSLAKHKVLVVEDNPSARDSLQCLLVSAGYHVATAKDGFDALLSLKVSLPDVIISDLNMPQMSGFELLSVVRRRFPTVLLIAMSGAFAGNTVPGGV